MATTKEKWQEIANRGLQDRFDPQTRAKFDEAVKRGLITLGEAQPVQEVESPSFGGQVLGGLENVGSLVSGALAEPVAGIAGIAQSLNPFAEEGAGAEAVKSTRDALTFKPRTEAGKSQQQAIGETLAPVGKALSNAEKLLGNETLALTGSPTLAAMAHTLPTAALELIGLKGSKAARLPNKKISGRSVKKAMIESAPETEKIKAAATAVYKDIDGTGARIKKESLQGLAEKIEERAKSQGMDHRTTKVSHGVVEAIKDSAKTNQKITELDKLRKIADAAAKSTDSTEKMLGSIIKSDIEDFMDNIKSTDMLKGSEGLAGTAKKYRTARNLYGRAKRSELINEAITEGQNSRSGVENGIRNELNKITRSKKLKKFFPKDELDAMNQVVQGDFKTNFAKMVGRMGFMEGSSTSVLGSLGGVYAGSSLLGPAGAVATPVAGIAARQIAKKLTTNKANFVDTIIKSGKDGKRITSAYLRAVPKGKRSPSDLADLLLDPNINIKELESVSNQMVKDALEIAKGRRVIDFSSSALAGSLSSSLSGGDNDR